MPDRLPTASVVIATYMRPTFVATCLEHVMRQTCAPLETIVVDASTDDRTAEVVRGFPHVRYIRNTRGAGTLATSRAMALEAAEGEVIAFLDDDAYARPDWLAELLLPYGDENVAAVGGRALNGQPGEDRDGIGEVGLLLPNGRLTGHFAADPGRVIDVDHMLGANMSLRSSIARRLGGIHDYYPGTCLREDADMPLRMRAAGYRVVYAPGAVVEHVAAPYERGRRFDLRYAYYGQRNHLVLLSRTLGIRSPWFRRYLQSAAREVSGEIRYSVGALVGTAGVPRGGRSRAVGGGIARASVKAAGLVSGSAQVLRLRLSEGPVTGWNPPSSPGSVGQRSPFAGGA